jgi:hypothetical protein
MKGTFIFAAGLFLAMPPLTVSADEFDSIWQSGPRGAIAIVIGRDGGLMSGPGWQHKFKANESNLNFEIAPGRRFVLRREGNEWLGEYFHPRIGDESQQSELHKMTFTCGAGDCLAAKSSR